MGSPGGSDGKNICNAGDPGSALGREDPWSVLGGSFHRWLQLLEPDLL